jgi:transposase
MEKINAVKLSPKEQYELRKRIIRLREKGLGNKKTAELLDLSPFNTSRVWQAYKREGLQGISLKPRGRIFGSKRTLTNEQEKEIRGILIDKTPDQLKFPWALWTREAICELIKRKYGIRMPLRSISHYLKRWQFTSQRPSKRAYKQDPAKIKEFLEDHYPSIVIKARAEKAEIYWGDETGIQNIPEYQRGFAPKGQTPVLLIQSKKEKINMLSAINNYGKTRFMIYEDNMTSSKLIEFMKRLCKDAGRKVFLILDNLKAHHSTSVAEWLSQNKDKIELFFLPSYAPEYNPVEYLNHDLKLNVHLGKIARSIKDLEHKTRSFMTKLQRRPLKVMAYFKQKYVRFASLDICYVLWPE